LGRWGHRRLKGLRSCNTYEGKAQEKGEEKSPTVIKFVTSSAKYGRNVQWASSPGEDATLSRGAQRKRYHGYSL
jgi:hypothetical protein